MKKFNVIELTIIIITLFCLSCVYDNFPSIAIVKNQSKNRIVVTKQRDTLMTDSIVYYKRFSGAWIEVNESRGIAVPNMLLGSQADSVKVFLYVFNCDSIDKHQASKSVKSILKNSLIKKFEIQLNQVKNPLDTIYIK